MGQVIISLACITPVCVLLFLLYTAAELFEIISSAGLVGHSYADHMLVYISDPAASASVSTQRFISCVECIDAWVRSNRLRMNADKTQLPVCQRITFKLATIIF